MGDFFVVDADNKAGHAIRKRQVGFQCGHVWWDIYRKTMFDMYTMEI